MPSPKRTVRSKPKRHKGMTWRFSDGTVYSALPAVPSHCPTCGTRLIAVAPRRDDLPGVFVVDEVPDPWPPSEALICPSCRPERAQPE